MARFCRERGYGLEIVPMEFTGILPAVTTGKCDLACGGIAYTDERAESVYFAEPTSALDPTTIGEVLSVIRNMSRQGMTMVIVTHEMKFARDVSNRVFYLDEGIVYEEGTPEQIFTTPVKEKTRQFIRHLQVLTIRIDGLRFDYGNALTQIETFGQQHMIERVLVRRMITLTEELGVEILQRRFREQTRAEILFELEESTGIIHAKITFQGAGFDPLTDGDPTSVALVRAAAPDITAKQEEDTVILSATLAAGS